MPRSSLRFDFSEELKRSLFQTFQIDLSDFLNTKMLLYLKLRISGSEIESMPFWEYQTLLENYLELLDKIEEAKTGKKKIL